MSLTPAFLDELRARTVLSTLIGKTTKLTKAGREYKGCCPFHQEKTPSFYVNDDKGFYHCFGCSAHGDAIRWLTDQRGLPFMDAVKELASSAGLEVPAPDPRAAERDERAKGLHEAMADAQSWFVEQLGGLAGADARALLERRGIRAETARSFGLGYSPDSRGKLKTQLKAYGDPLLIEAGLLISGGERAPYDRFRGRLMIPIRSPRGQVIAFGGRVIGDGEPKYLNSPDTPLFDKGRTLYNLDRALPAARKADRVIVVEGYMDVIALAQAGIGEAVAPLGTALTEAQLERLWRIADVPILCFDGDAAGQKAALRAAQRALPLMKGDQSLRFVTLPQGKDPDDVVREKGVPALEALIEAAIPLNELLWRTELAAMPLKTPEQRAGLGRRLREHAKVIQDPEVKTEYLAEFTDRVWNLFHPDRPSKSFKTFGHNAQRVPISERLKAIAEYGIDQVTLIPAFIQGLIRFPGMIAPLAEAFGRIPINATKLRQVREHLLDMALVTAHRDAPLETADVLTILRKDALGPVADKLANVTLAFSFLAHKADADQAGADLALVAEKLDVGPAIDSELNEAKERYIAHWNDAYFEDYVRLVRAKQRMEQIFMDALLPDEDPVE